MDNTSLHKAISEDGITIVGKVIGTGEPLVLLPPGPAECEQGWKDLLPFLIDHFTCYLFNPRGRGLSEDHPDHSPERLTDDVLSFSQSIGQPVTLLEGGSGLWAYTTAQNHPSIRAAAVYEPGVDEVLPDPLADQLGQVFMRVADIAANGRLVEAADYFIEHSHIIYSDEELATGVPKAFWQVAANNIPIFLAEQAAIFESSMPNPMDSTILSKIQVPVLLILGTKTTTYFIDSLKYVANHVQNVHIQKIDQAAHFGICTHPEAVADVLVNFVYG